MGLFGDRAYLSKVGPNLVSDITVPTTSESAVTREDLVSLCLGVSGYHNIILVVSASSHGGQAWVGSVTILSFHTVPMRNFQWKLLLLMSKAGFTFHGAGKLSLPLATPFGFNGGRSCRIETA